jgi:hypothetical protein
MSLDLDLGLGLINEIYLLLLSPCLINNFYYMNQYINYDVIRMNVFMNFDELLIFKNIY